ncbi:hypothetical protein SAMN05216284_105127 [Micromonospora sediminimaris]|uniref:Transposase DDE domain-containing protein n=1 Tax=Micromonospora sediminimaris TaxID=547162 RepID=A0A9W5XMW5_9ACTN|nr:hypothetical protein Vse01_44610 [Micromonospora sediminimaris]SFC52781.1 hypothetical protein SAMN05216284_105127 [Micromonospora sediminimaris]
MFTQLFTQFWAGLSGQRRDQVIHYQYRADWACRTLRGIDEQIAKAERPLPARPPSSATGSSTWPAAPAPSTGPRRPRPSRGGLKGYVTNLATCPDGTPVTAQFVIDAYHRLVQIEKSFRMSKHDLQAPPIYHRQRDSTDAHLTIMFSALAVSH